MCFAHAGNAVNQILYLIYCKAVLYPTALVKFYSLISFTGWQQRQLFVGFLGEMLNLMLLLRTFLSSYVFRAMLYYFVPQCSVFWNVRHFWSHYKLLMTFVHKKNSSESYLDMHLNLLMYCGVTFFLNHDLWKLIKRAVKGFRKCFAWFLRLHFVKSVGKRCVALYFERQNTGDLSLIF